MLNMRSLEKNSYIKLNIRNLILHLSFTAKKLHSKRFLKYTFLFIFVFVLAYVMFILQLAEHKTQKASDDYIKELSKEIVDREIWNRVKDLPIEKSALIMFNLQNK